MTSYQKCTRMLLLFFLIQRNLSVAKSRWMSVSPCCYKEFLVCFNCPRCLVLGTLSLLPVVPLVLTVNQISLLPSREPYFAPWPYTFTMTFHFERIFFLFFFFFLRCLHILEIVNGHQNWTQSHFLFYFFGNSVWKMYLSETVWLSGYRLTALWEMQYNTEKYKYFKLKCPIKCHETLWQAQTSYRWDESGVKRDVKLFCVSLFGTTCYQSAFCCIVWFSR